MLSAMRSPLTGYLRNRTLRRQGPTLSGKSCADRQVDRRWSGSDDEAPPIQHHGICYAAVLLGKRQNIDVGPPDGREPSRPMYRYPSPVSSMSQLSVLGDGEHRLWGGPLPCLKACGAFDLDVNSFAFVRIQNVALCPSHASVRSCPCPRAVLTMNSAGRPGAVCDEPGHRPRPEIFDGCRKRGAFKLKSSPPLRTLCFISMRLIPPGR